MCLLGSKTGREKIQPASYQQQNILLILDVQQRGYVKIPHVELSYQSRMHSVEDARAVYATNLMIIRTPAFGWFVSPILRSWILVDCRVILNVHSNKERWEL